MGRWMCKHIMDAGFKVSVFNRSSEKVKPLLELGATHAKSPREVSAYVDVGW